MQYNYFYQQRYCMEKIDHKKKGIGKWLDAQKRGKEEDEETEIRNWAGQEDHAAYAPALFMHMLPG
jgi:hypothetical protein